MSQEYEFLEYVEQLECIKEDLELYKGDPAPYQRLIALDNTVTALESTRYPGNCNLLEIRKEIRKLLAKEQRYEETRNYTESSESSQV